MAYSIYSVVEQLSKLDQVLAEKLIDPDASALEKLARIGELVTIRSDLVQNLTEEALLQLIRLRKEYRPELVSIQITAAEQWQLVKALALVRGYVSDLETLLNDD